MIDKMIKILQDQKPVDGWPRLSFKLETNEKGEIEIDITSLEIVLLFNSNGYLLGAYNYKQ